MSDFKDILFHIVKTANIHRIKFVIGNVIYKSTKTRLLISY